MITVQNLLDLSKFFQTSKTHVFLFVWISVLSLSVFYSINTVSAISESDCLSLSSLGTIEQSYTVVTCDNPFNVSVNMGQRLHIQNPSGGSGNMLPSASYGTVGTYQYSSGSPTGTIKLQNPPDVGISFQNVQVSFSGSQMSVSGNIVNSNSFPVKNLYVYWHVTDNSGKYHSSWQRFGNDGQAYSTLIQAQSIATFSETVCCLPSSGAVQATPYLVQAFREDGTKLISTSNAPVNPPDGSFVLPCSMQEKGDGVFTSSCNGVYENGFAKAKVGINYGSGLLPIKNYVAVGFFIDKNGNQGQNIKVTLDQINPKESKELVFVNPVSGFVSEFKMQMLGGQLVTETTPQPPTTLPTEVTVMITKGSANNQNCGDQCFVPNTVQIAVGGEVIWLNADSAAHTVTEVNGNFDSSLISPAGKFTQKFNTAGTNAYMDIVHPWAKGTVVVGGSTVIPKPQPKPAQYVEFKINTESGTVIALDKSQYQIGEIVIINGKGFEPTESVSVLISDRNQNRIEELSLSSTKSGTFQTLWKIPDNLSAGKYVIMVSSVSQQLEEIPSSSGRVTISGKINPVNVDVNNRMDVTLRVVGVLVNGQSDNIVLVKQVKPSRDGFFEDSFFVPNPTITKTGDYKVIANYANLKSEAVFTYNGDPNQISVKLPPLGSSSNTKTTENIKEKSAKEQKTSEKIKSKEQIAKEKANKLKKEKELAKKKAIEKAKQKAIEKAKQKAKEIAQKKSTQKS